MTYESVEIGARFCMELLWRCIRPWQAMDGKTDVEVSRTHVRQVLTLMHKERGIQDLSL